MLLKNTHHVYKAFQSFCFRISSQVMLPFPCPFRPRSNQSWRVCVWHKTRGLWQRGNCPFGQQVSQTHISHTERFIWWWLVHSAFSELLSECLNGKDITLNVMSCSFNHIRVKWIVVVVVFLNYIKVLICRLAKTLMQGPYFNVNFLHIMCPAWWVCWDSGTLSSVQTAVLKVRA